MVFSTNPTHQIHFLILIFTLSLTFLSQNHNLVVADEGLIQKTCHSTEVSELCEQCLDSNPSSKEADVIGIATNIVQCVSKHATFLQSNMTDLASKLGIAEDLKEAYLNCSTGYLGARKKYLFKVGSWLQKGDFDGANRFISNAVYIQYACRVDLENHKWEPEPNIIYDMNSYDDLSVAAMRIIDRL